MAEESVAKLFAEISADVEDFEVGIDVVETRLDKLEKKEAGVNVETKGVENSVSSLGVEMGVLAGALTTVFSFLQQNSGALSALTDMAGGLIGAGIDTFFSEILLPLWEELKNQIGDTSEGISNMDKPMNDLAGLFEVNDVGVLTLKDDALKGNEAVTEFLKVMNDGKQDVDDYGNSVFIVGDSLFFYDEKTGDFIGRTNDLNAVIGDVHTNLGIATELIGDVSTAWGVMASDVTIFAEGGREALEALWADDPSQFPGSVYISRVADAAEEVKLRLSAMLIQIGIDPSTGEALPEGVTVRFKDPLQQSKVDEYLGSGGD